MRSISHQNMYSILHNMDAKARQRGVHSTKQIKFKIKWIKVLLKKNYLK